MSRARGPARARHRQSVRTSPDLRQLLAREGRDRRAADAVALFCYQAKKRIGAFAAVLGGI